MSARQGGSFATLLLAIPLSAIPLMAIFGIPEFAHVSATTEQAVPDIVRQPSASFDDPPSGTDPAERHRRQAADLLSPANDKSSPSAVMPDAADTTESERPAESSVSAGGDSVQQRPSSPRPMQTAAPEPLIRTVTAPETAPAPAATPTGLTWRDAARQLEDVGITDYRLERGESADRFLFVCRFSPGDDQRIVQRFEAEADEPLAAVEQVLAQVDQWLQHRYADSRRWLR